MPVARMTTRWDGWPGAPGFTALHFSTDYTSESAVAIAVRDFFDTFKTWITGVATLTPLPEIEIFDQVTGTLLSAIPHGETWSIAGGGGGAFAAPAGGCIAWSTGGIARGRRVRGRTFAVPFGNGSYDGNGSLQAAAVAQMTLAAGGLASNDDANLVIWSRPRDGAGGTIHPVTGWRVTDQAAVLRSRRD